MDQQTIRGIIIVAVIVAVIFLYVKIREWINLGKARTGEDQELLRQTVQRALSGETGYQVAYAHWEKVEHFGRRTRTTYYCYALAFGNGALWVFPLRREKNEVKLAQPVKLTSELLGIAQVQSTANRDGEVRQVSIVLADKDGQEFLTCNVDHTNTREDRFHPFNIIQPEACEQFSRFMTSFSAQVSRENEGLEDRVREENNRTYGKRALILGIVGIFLSVFPLLGLVVSGIGLLIAPKPGDTGGKLTAPLIVCIISVALSILFPVSYFFLL